MLLRLAVLLHRSRSDLPLPDYRVSARGRELRLAFPDHGCSDTR
ncbi:MAG: hypothetical protein U5K43_09685 [Halofilum sp. (in: g-proteobacteria)]|nr:hypothetical protein [Halofilum sp. (in: g-proteobacteria)]